MKRFSKGYKPSMDGAKLHEFKSKFNVHSMLTGVCYLFCVLASIFLSPWIVTNLSKNLDNILLTTTLNIILVVFISRQFRYLENVVHFVSHKNFSKNSRVNDLIVNIFAAYPVIQNVEGYRKFHKIHHGYFGSEKDPCKQRMNQLKIDTKGYENIKNLCKTMVSNIHAYLFVYYREIGSNLKNFILFILWHTVFAGCILLIFGKSVAELYIYSAITAFLVVLPVIRYIAEVSEHDYETYQTEFQCTFNNLSIIDRLLIHPAGDAYHLVHHLYPSIPWWLQSKAHRFLYAHDSSYRIANNRTNLMQKIAIYKELEV